MSHLIHHRYSDATPGTLRKTEIHHTGAILEDVNGLFPGGGCEHVITGQINIQILLP